MSTYLWDTTGKNQRRAAGRGRAHNSLIGIFLGKLWVHMKNNHSAELWKKNKLQYSCMYVCSKTQIYDYIALRTTANYCPGTGKRRMLKDELS